MRKAGKANPESADTRRPGPWVVCLRMARLGAVLLAGVIVISCASPHAGSQNTASAPVQQLSLAVGPDCPPLVEEILITLCDDVQRISQGEASVSIQHWDDPLASGADLCFVLPWKLARQYPELQVLGMDYLFSSYEHMSAAMNAKMVLETVSEPLQAAYGYRVHSAFYYGRSYLVAPQTMGEAPEGIFIKALREDESKRIESLVGDFARDYRDGDAPILPLPIGAFPESDRMYYADTQILSALSAQEAAGYILVDTPYRYAYGFLCMGDGLSQKITPSAMAALYEAAAIAKPACDQAFLEQDVALRTGFAEVMIPSQKLRRAVRERQNATEDFPIHTPLYQILDNYSV